MEDDIWNHKSMSSYIKHYNGERFHWLLDVDSLQTPLRAFSDRGNRSDQENNPKWMEEDANG